MAPPINEEQMNWNEKGKMMDRLLKNLAKHMISHGIIESDRHQSNYYCCIRIVRLIWRGQPFTIIEVDGRICRIERE